MPRKIFVNYQRDDGAANAARLRDHLARAFGAGNVFMDVDNLLAGLRFDKELEAALAECDVFLAVMGPRWRELLAARGATGERDYVREEIAAALAGGIIVIPVLVERATVPRAAELPVDIRGLVLHQKHDLSHEHFGREADALIATIKALRKRGRSGGSRIEVNAKIGHGAPDGWFKPGAGKSEWFKDIDIGPENVVVPAGSFTMGSSRAEIAALKKEYLYDWPDREGPQRTVTINAPFAVGRFAITFDEWDAADLPHKPGDNAWGRGMRPVINVSWEDAKEYANWLSQKTGKEYRLLSEAEWEYCCRGGTTTKYAYGDSLTRQQAQFSEGGWCSAKQTVEVGKFPPNLWGLFDIHGNVFEWCEDNWHPDYKGAPQDGSVWQGGEASVRVLRGGSWVDVPQNLRSAYRDRSLPNGRGYGIGFRLARTL